MVPAPVIHRTVSCVAVTTVDESYLLEKETLDPGSRYNSGKSKQPLPGPGRFSLLLSIFVPLLELGFSPRKGSGQLQQLKHCLEEPKPRDSLLSPYWEEPELALSQLSWDKLSCTSRLDPKLRASSKCSMKIKRHDTQKAPGAMTNTYLSKLGLLLDNKCEGWGRGAPL